MSARGGSVPPHPSAISSGSSKRDHAKARCAATACGTTLGVLEPTGHTIVQAEKAEEKNKYKGAFVFRFPKDVDDLMGTL